MKRSYILAAAIAASLLTSCTIKNDSLKASGKLFIIGGGDKPAELMNELIDLSGIRTEGYMFVLPMAGSEPDSSIIWVKEDFSSVGVRNIYGFNFLPGSVPPQDKIDSIINAKLIYISGGDQSRFIEATLNTPVMHAILYAYKKGAVIAGTSAGAAVMSRKMITGNQQKHPESETGFTTIEAENIEIIEGLGLLENVIIDQHFIKRQRLNRLVAASIENPGQLCVGIDESTAIIVDGNNATVTGLSQVVVIRNPKKVKTVNNGLLGSEDLRLNIYTPGQKFILR